MLFLDLSIYFFQLQNIQSDTRIHNYISTSQLTEALIHFQLRLCWAWVIGLKG